MINALIGIMLIGMPETDQDLARQAFVRVVREESSYRGLDYMETLQSLVDRVYVKYVSMEMQCAGGWAKACTREGTRRADGAQVALIEYTRQDTAGLRGEIMEHEMRHAVYLLLGDPSWVTVGHR